MFILLPSHARALFRGRIQIVGREIACDWSRLAEQSGRDDLTPYVRRVMDALLALQSAAVSDPPEAVLSEVERR